MSRIGRAPIEIPAGVEVTCNGTIVTVKGPKGTLTHNVHPDMTVTVEGNTIHVTRPSDDKLHRSLHGLTRTLIHNMVIGVSAGYTKKLSIEGTGFKAVLQGTNLALSLGFASPKIYPIPAGIKATVENDGLQVTVTGCDKDKVGEAAARIRSFYPAEPYKGKGIKYVGEHIRRKQGKKVA